MKKVTLVAIYCFLINSACAETHLFILSGQSNMVRMKELEGFIPEIKRLIPNGDIQYIKVAFPGKPIRLWVEEWNEIAKRKEVDVKAARAKDTKEGTPYYNSIIAKSKALMQAKPKSLTFVWMQGESDAKPGLDKVYEEALIKLISRLRKELDTPDMNIVISRISDYGTKNPRGKAFPGWLQIRKAQERIVAEDKRAAMVNTDDLNGAGNGLHYPPEGYKLMGERMARQAVALIKGEKPDPKGSP